MDYLVDYYTTYLQLEDYSTEFSDKKAIFEGMIVVRQNGQYGVVNASKGEALLETKYDSVSYLPNTKDFLVKSNGKYGVVTKNGSVKIKVGYDAIKIMDNENGLYLIKENNLYGVVNTKGNVIIEPEYQQIGVDALTFSQNGIESQYVILNELIPIKNNNLWGFFNKKGEQITDFKYTSLGCTSSKVANSYPVLVVPSYNIIIVRKDKNYNLMKLDGKEVIEAGYVLDSVYMTINVATSENKFYMTYNGKTADVEQQLLNWGI